MVGSRSLTLFLRQPLTVAAPESPSLPPPPAAIEREVKEAQSYLAGWFGAPVALPRIEIVSAGSEDGTAGFPGHYHDGIIRLRAETLLKDAELRRVLRHELTHAIIDERTRGNCPHWLHEGIAQFLDGTDVVAVENRLRRDPKAIVPLFRIEGPFRDRDSPARAQAYRQSASAVSFLVSRIGRTGLLFLIQRLGEGRPFERALLETGLSYNELQQAWESSLRLPKTPK